MRPADLPPVLDGHNDLPHALRRWMHQEGEDALRGYGLREGAPGHTDLARLRAGGVGGQFWAAYVPCDRNGGADRVPRGATRHAVEQLELIRRLESDLADALTPCWTAASVREAWKGGRIASLVGVEGGHALEGSLATLRVLRRLGARYLTLTHNCTTRWADSATDAALHGGLTAFGREVVRELNRLGMLVDLSHVSADVMRHALEVTEAPVVFTHSSARALCPHPRNVPDDILIRLRSNGGMVMVTWVPRFVSPVVLQASEDGGEGRGGEAPESGSRPRATVEDVADHMDHVRRVAGIEHVGIGGDLDGTAELPRGLEGAGAYPTLLEALADRGWSRHDLARASSGNVLRVMAAAEAVGQRLRSFRPPSWARLEDDADAPGGRKAKGEPAGAES
jgi:membrane dipeptidase